jgi:glycosyltransferase involved in cell wall biosynthesis
MKVLALASYPTEAAATRYRLEQFVIPLAERGITLTVHPFLDSKHFENLYRRQALPSTALGLIRATLRRSAALLSARQADVVLIQREAMIFGPPLIEWLTARVMKRPMVLDLDDATYVSYTSPTYGGLGKALKWFSKTDDLIRWATVVICGNRSIAEYVSSKGARARIIPTVVDTEVFRPACPTANAGGTDIDPTANEGVTDINPPANASGTNKSSHRTKSSRVVLGWIGTHSTFPYLESIFPVLTDLSKDYDFRLKVVGAGKDEITVPGVEIENSRWSLDREVRDFQSIDIGLYPIDAGLYSGKWAAGKSGFKAIQYMAVGVPYVATPVGASAELGEVGITHFFAANHQEWRDALAELIVNANKRKQMGAAGRCHVTKHFALPAQTDKLAAVLREAATSN